jgi:glucosyl-3-phosphoglycerate synthase
VNLARGKPIHVVVPMLDEAATPDAVRSADSIFRGCRISLLRVVEQGAGVTPALATRLVREARAALRDVIEAIRTEGGRTRDVRGVVRVDAEPAAAIIEAAADAEADLILLGPPAVAAGGSTAPTQVEYEVVRHATCDVAILRGPVRTLDRVTIAVRGGPNADLALAMGAAIAQSNDVDVRITHLTPTGLTLAGREILERALEDVARRHGLEQVDRCVRETSDVRATILEEAAAADLIILGAAALPYAPEGEAVLGPIPEAVLAEAPSAVLVVRSRERITPSTFDALARVPGTLPSAERTSSLRAATPRVARWFAESNFHHAEFADLRRLVALKERQGLTVSLVLPTLNEEETVGPIVRTARRTMMEDVPLVDQLLVIDSASTDRTRALAEAEGARVIQHPDVLPRYGSFRGKGEALWKSLYETSGDIVVWADTDVREWHPRLVYGTLGPLLAEPGLQYVKGYYERPILEGGVLREGGGGRVTELVARPLINLFYPDLSGFVQPLAGEYAGRRSLLESIPFSTGYGVEIGHLIDVVERVGLDGLGQVDLERRVHRNQDLRGLSRMSFVITQAVISRLERQRRVRLFADLGTSMKLPSTGPDGLGLEVVELGDDERPPMLEIPEYRARRGLEAVASVPLADKPPPTEASAAAHAAANRGT